MGVYEHAKRELEIAGFFDDDADYGGLLGDAVLKLIEVFAEQGHSGYSGPTTAHLFEKLAKYEPITPLTGEDWEWSSLAEYQDDAGPIMYQNTRNSAVFKDGKDGQAYYIDAVIFDGDLGGSFTGSNIKLPAGGKISSRQYIKSFPFTPKTFYVDVIDYRYAEDRKTIDKNGDWWEHEVKDVSQLDEVKEYYDFKVEE